MKDMAKGKVTSVFFCQECGYETSKWMGQCPGCKEWNTMVEEKVDKKSISTSGKLKQQEHEAIPMPLSKIVCSEEERVSTKILELDRVLGGGIVRGSLVLVGGDPGIGKSTLLLQVCRNLSTQKLSVLYVSGEESLQQIKMRAVRIGTFTDDLELLCETNLDTVKSVMERKKPQIVIIDSIQTMYNDSVGSAPGSVSQVRESTAVLMQLAKGVGISIFIVGHVTKEGMVAGPRVLEHMVDTVLYFEGDRHQSYRILRGVKNRFGSTNEIGVFEMRNEGLVEVENASEYMLSGKPKGASGSVVFCGMEGSRPLLCDVQALAAASYFGTPRRTVAGADSGRVALLLAVLEKRCSLRTGNQDVYINVAGGLELSEPAADLALCLAVASSLRDESIGQDVAVMGEVGLAGEVRAIPQCDRRIAECERLGFSTIILPRENMKRVRAPEGVKLIGVDTVMQALSVLF